MAKDNSISSALSISMNPLLHINKPPTKDKIRTIIKNQNGDQLLFKDKAENWEPITIKRLDRCELKYLTKEILKQVLPSMRIDNSQLVLATIKTHEFHSQEYIFNFTTIVPNDAEIRIPRGTTYIEFKWVSENKSKQNKIKGTKNLEHIDEPKKIEPKIDSKSEIKI